MGVAMSNTTQPASGSLNVTETQSGFTERENALLLAIGATATLLILQSFCFIIYVIRAKRRLRQKRKRSGIPFVREPLPNQENTIERYSSRPLKHVSDPEIYESLKDLILSVDTIPPLPPISTLPKRKPTENSKLLDTLNGSHSYEKDKELTNSMATRPPQPLPNETEDSGILSKNNISATMPRMKFPKPIPTPIMSSTMSRFPNRDSPLVNRGPRRPMKPEMPLPRPHPTTLSLASNHIPVSHPEPRISPKPKSHVEVPVKYRLPPPEPNLITLPSPEIPVQQTMNSPTRIQPQQITHEIPVENELLEKLKKRAQLIPLSTQEIPVQQIINSPTRIQPQQIQHEPYIQDELMQKLKKRAALIPDSENEKEMQQPNNSAHRVKTPMSKPLPPLPRRSESEDTWVDNFDNREASEQIHMYNI